MSLRILAVAPDPGVRESLELLLAEAGYEATCTSDAGTAADLLGTLQPDLCFWSGFDPEARAAAAALARRAPRAIWIAVCEPGDPAEALAAALELGFDDHLDVRASAPQVALLLRRAARVRRARDERLRLERELQESVDSRPIVGASPAMIELLEALENAAGFPAHVLIQGEPGTGKEGLARAIHAQSARRRGPFVRLVARPGDAARIASELFGAPGAAGAAGRLVEAQGGVLFLDGVHALEPDSQERLLSALESEELDPRDGGKPRRIDVRVIAASVRDLRAAASSGEFLPELHTRLRGVELRVPPLRERSRDIPLLIDHFVGRASRRLGTPLRGVTDEALARLVAYPWPGNVRELENVIERAVLLARGERVSPRHLPADLEFHAQPRDADLALRRNRKRLEAELIRHALQRTGGNRTRAARLLEISHRALLYKLKEYGIRD